MRVKVFFAFLIICLCVLSLPFYACGMVKSDAKKELDSYLNELEKTEEYDLLLVKRHIDAGKTQIDNASDDAEIAEIKNETLRNAQKYVLSYDMALEIKSAFCKSRNSVDESNLKIDYYLGQYGEFCVLMFRGVYKLTQDITNLDGYTFPYDGRSQVYVYDKNDKSIVSVLTAYTEEKKLSFETVKEIHDKYIEFDFYKNYSNQ